MTISTLRWSSLFAASVLLGALWADAAITDHAGHDHRGIRIGDRKLFPKTLKIGSSDAVVWYNYSEHVAVVSFSDEVTASLVCTQPSNFRRVENRLESNALRGNEFASVCMFKPGSYPYRVTLHDISPSVKPPRVLRGTLEVD